MNKEMRKKLRVKIDSRKELAKPRKMSIGIVTDNSRSLDFNEAKIEWELENAIDETTEGFSNICELCNNPHLKYNFVILNPNTRKRLRVGSTCIIHFGLISGNVDVESGALIINNFIDEKYYLTEIRSRINSVLVYTPEAKDLKEFHHFLKKYFELKGIKEPTPLQLCDVCFEEGRVISFNNSVRITAIWDKPETIDTIKSKVKRDPVFKEYTTWGHKKRTGNIYNTGAGRSSEYNVERHVENKDGGKL